MTEAIRGDVLTKKEMQKRGIKMIPGSFGGVELRAPTYDVLIVTVLQQRGFVDDKHINAACDYLELKNAIYCFLNPKTMGEILGLTSPGVTKSNAETGYYTAHRYLGKNKDMMIVRAMNEPADTSLEHMMVVDAYRQAFHTVFDAIDLAKSAIQKEIENALDSHNIRA